MADVFKDLNDMHAKYGFHARVAKMTPTELKEMLEFRWRFLSEELTEMANAIGHGDAEGVVDALVDLVVVAVGTLDLYGVDGPKAWRAVHEANMNKEPGIKASRPNKLGLPDLIKPPGWVAPDHEGNHGRLDEAAQQMELPF